MVVLPTATKLIFQPDNIKNVVDIRESESHGIIKNHGKTVLMSNLSHNCKDKYPNNANCNVFKYPILPDIIPFRSKNGWNLQNSDYIGDDIQCGIL